MESKHESRASALLLAAFAVAGCAGVTMPWEQRRPGPDRAAVARLSALAAVQVRRCYRSPRIAREGRQIVTRLRARFARDGSLIGLPAIVGQTGVTPANRVYAVRMAQAATLAVMRCAPVKLPPELWQGGWDELDFTFSPGGLA